MSGRIIIERANTVLYCANWAGCVEFYRSTIGLQVAFENDWFVEFRLAGSAMLSVADASRATVASVAGGGLTLTWLVESVTAARDLLTARGVAVTPPSTRWGATVCYCHDPEGHRIELWEHAPTVGGAVSRVGRGGPDSSGRGHGAPGWER